MLSDICLISNNNGWGLTRDVRLLKEILSEKYKTVKFQQWNESKAHPEKFRINLHIEMVGGGHFRNASRNYLIPNQEWFLIDWVRRKGRFQKTLCKTKSAVDTFTRLGFRNVEYIGFTTHDICDLSVPRALEFVHVSGNSVFKGTDQVVKLWAKHPEYPKLHLYNVWKNLEVDLPNVDYHFGKVSEEELRYMQNRCLYHIQPSNAEGFGHVIWEGLAVGGLVITTDAPPMNEIPGVFLTGAVKRGQYNNGMIYDVELEALEKNVDYALGLRDFEIEAMQKGSRLLYLKNHDTFKERILNVI